MALINKPSYSELMENGPIDIAISPQTISIGAILEHVRRGDVDVLVTSPEQLARPDVLDSLAAGEPSLLAIDEVHCVCDWGPDFRPDYLRIGELRRALGIPLAAFTATADEETREEIVQKLFGGREPLLTPMVVDHKAPEFWHDTIAQSDWREVIDRFLQHAEYDDTLFPPTPAPGATFAFPR